MNEPEYIDATNLAKLRIMQHICRDLLAMKPKEEAIQRLMRQQLAVWIEMLEDRQRPRSEQAPDPDGI